MLLGCKLHVAAVTVHAALDVAVVTVADGAVLDVVCDICVGTHVETH